MTYVNSPEEQDKETSIVEDNKKEENSSVIVDNIKDFSYLENEKEGEISKLEGEIASLKEQMLRALAEAENTRKRSIKEKEEMAKYAITDFSRALLGVADNLRRALESGTDAPDSSKDSVKVSGVLTGVEMTEKELGNVFEKYGIRRITPKGEKFDPYIHQAVVEIESSQEEGTVVEVLQAGYLLHDRVLRPAMVTVAKKE
jgi:molecular chaperone GrpE